MSWRDGYLVGFPPFLFSWEKREENSNRTIIVSVCVYFFPVLFFDEKRGKTYARNDDKERER